MQRRMVLAAICTLPFARPAMAGGAWAQPVTMGGVPNLHLVTPQIYRSAQPTAEGFQALAKAGIKTVISLRRSVEDAPLAQGTGLRLIHYKIKTRHLTADNSALIVAALRSINATAKPVLVHCTHGADRTGLVIALWRMLYQGWSRDEVLAELTEGGFGFHQVWVNIPRFIREVDLEALRKRVET